MGAQNAHWLTRLDQQRLIVLQALERAHNGVEGGPVARSLPCAAVNHQLVRSFGYFRIEIVHQHAQGSFLLPALGAQPGSSRRTNYVFMRTSYQSLHRESPLPSVRYLLQ